MFSPLLTPSCVNPFTQKHSHSLPEGSRASKHALRNSFNPQGGVCYMKDQRVIVLV